MQTLFSIIGLGFLGLDPIGASLAASAIVAGTKKYKILLFTLSFLLGTVVLGVFFSMLGQSVINRIQSNLPDDSSPIWLILNIAIIAIIIIWLSTRFAKRNKKEEKEKRVRKSPLGSTWQFILAGLLLALSSFTDPTIYAVIIIAAETHNVFAMIGLNLLWITISQIPLIAVVVALYLNKHERLLNSSRRIWKTHKEKITMILYILAIFVALVLLIDAVVYLINGYYLLP